jgi:hypothetical protein
MKRFLARIPVVGGLLRRAAKAWWGWTNARRIRNSLHLSPRRIVIGASSAFDPGWIPTEIEALNILRETDWERFFRPGSIDAMPRPCAAPNSAGATLSPADTCGSPFPTGTTRIRTTSSM